MQTARVLRQQIESVLSARLPDALSPRARQELDRTPCGIASVDELMLGGIPTGVVTELVGAECSGRTAMALAYMAAITRQGSVCAWIDVADVLDPESVAANGVDLERMLWIRCGATQQASLTKLETTPTLAAAPSAPPRHTGGGSLHPRSEGRDMPEAITAMLQAHGGLYDHHARREKKKIGTPGAPNRPVASRPEERVEQVNSDRLPARRGDNLTIAPRCAEPQPRRVASVYSGKRMPVIANTFKAPTSSRPWQAIDQALRATDLLLQGGGFSAIVLDLGSTPAEAAWRIPLATWFRFRAACERTRVSLLLLTQHPCSRSSAELVVRLAPGSMEAESKVMTGIRYRAEIERSRTQPAASRVVPIRKPPQPERPGQWKSNAAWTQAGAQTK